MAHSARAVVRASAKKWSRRYDFFGHPPLSSRPCGNQVRKTGNFIYQTTGGTLMHPFFRNLGLGALVIAVGLIVLPTAHAKSPKIKICGSDTIFNNGSAGAVYTEKTKPNGEIMKTFSCVAKDIVHEAARRYNLLRCFYVNDNQDIFQLAEINLEPEDPDDPTSAL